MRTALIRLLAAISALAFLIILDRPPASVWAREPPGQLAGDFNGDCEVDGRDFLVWRNAYGSAPGQLGWNPHADANGDHTVDTRDYIIWRKATFLTCEQGPRSGHSMPRGLANPAPPADLNGTWQIRLTGSLNDSCSYTFRQSDRDVAGTGTCSLSTSTGTLAGRIDPATGMFTLSGSIANASVAAEGVVIRNEGFGHYEVRTIPGDEEFVVNMQFLR